MNRRIRYFLLLAVMIFTFCSSYSGAGAEEAETAVAETVVAEIEAAAATTTVTSMTKGWHTIGGYRFYYNAKGKPRKGWRKIKQKLYYFRTEAEGDAPVGSMVTGLYSIDGTLFYFSDSGVLQTGGWTKIKGKYYYLTQTGSTGKIGALYVGLKKIGGYTYYFNKNGKLVTGWKTVNKKTYYFQTSSSIGVRGRAVTNCWKTIGGYTYYFNSKGVLQKNCWVTTNYSYYVDENGRILKNCVTPDGYIVDKYGRKQSLASGWITVGSKYYYYVKGVKTVGWKKIGGKKYYFNANGVRQKGWLALNGAKYYLKKGVMVTGWQTISGKTYYFKNNGKMAVNTIVDGIMIGADGVADMTSKATRILLISGHGQGDVGAIAKYGSTTYYEYKMTRTFSTLIQQKLTALSPDNITVDMYDQNYDCYQVVAGTAVGPNPNFTSYDYVLEIHFNAAAESSKDLSGDGSYKGVGMYVNTAKADVTLDKNIVAAVANTGFRVWGGGTGIFRSSGLLNAKTCQGLGVSYGLLETAFIDDRDDFTFYGKNKDAMATAVATAIVKYFS